MPRAYVKIEVKILYILFSKYDIHIFYFFKWRIPNASIRPGRQRHDFNDNAPRKIEKNNVGIRRSTVHGILRTDLKGVFKGGEL